MRIVCVKDYGYKWITSKQGSYFKGYIVSDTFMAKICRGMEALSLFDECIDFDEFVTFLKNVDGVFSIIVRRPDCIWAAVDISRSMPIYFSTDGSIISDSGEHIRQELGIDKEYTDPLRMFEMLQTASVVGNNTVYKEIRQLNMGQALEVTEHGVRLETYFKHWAETADISEQTAMDSLKDVSSDMIKQIINVVDGRPIVLSLSGGYDSRYVACLLKSHGVENVSCYTYGAADSFESRQSKIVADALGYRWACVEHTNELIKDILSDENKPYFDMCNEHDYTIYLQNFVAVKQLHNNGWFYPNSVFLTGLCHDMPTGCYVKPLDDYRKYELSSQGVARYIIEQYYVRYPLIPAIRAEYEKEVVNSIELLQIPLNDYRDFIKVVDCITTGYDHSRQFLSMNRVHEYFGYEWLLPCWDKNLLSYWYSLPPAMRIKQNHYEKWLMEVLFRQFSLDTRKVLLSHSPNKKIAKIKRGGGGILVRILYPLGIPLQRKTDQNNFAPLEVMLYKRIKQKYAIKYERAALTLLLTIYIMEQRYGADFYNKLNILFAE